MKKQIIYLLSVVLLIGCSSGSIIVTGEKRDPINPSEVTIYQNSPSKKYEVIGIVKSESVEFVSEQEAVNRAVEELKNQAAMVGANGIILESVSEKQESYINHIPLANGPNHFYSATDEYQVLHGAAIYTK